MEEIKIIVADKIASVEDAPTIICGNSDYVVKFTFDDEWANENKKTAHFVYYQDGLKKNIPVEFEGDTCNVPVLVNTEQVSIGVSASGMMTTTGAEVRCKKSILCEVDKEEIDLFEMGKNSAKNPLEYATDMRYTFMNSQFPTGYELCVNLPVVTTMANAFYSAKGVKKITVEGNKNETAIAFNQAFRGCTDLEEVDLKKFCAKINNGSDMCYSATKLRAILGELDFTEMTALTPTSFAVCGELAEMRLKKNSLKLSINLSYSAKLSSETVQSIIDGLADLTGTDAQTLSLHSTTSSALTGEQMTQIVSKNWQLS